mmetsp:Transcript_49071/g.144954  ORF Transcript_49071/g.144954 Transcript_49071/m.144954 type:complete len:618 (-) Transcript_49071:32-1885(-)
MDRDANDARIRGRLVSLRGVQVVPHAGRLSRRRRQVDAGARCVDRSHRLDEDVRAQHELLPRLSLALILIVVFRLTVVVLIVVVGGGFLIVVVVEIVILVVIFPVVVVLEVVVVVVIITRPVIVEIIVRATISLIVVVVAPAIPPVVIVVLAGSLAAARGRRVRVAPPGRIGDSGDHLASGSFLCPAAAALRRVARAVVALEAGAFDVARNLARCLRTRLVRRRLRLVPRLRLIRRRLHPVLTAALAKLLRPLAEGLLRRRRCGVAALLRLALRGTFSRCLLCCRTIVCPLWRRPPPGGAPDLWVVWKLVPERAHHQRAVGTMRGEERVQVWEESVSQVQRLPHLPRHLLAKQVRLAPLRLELRVRTKERVEHCRLVPPDEQLRGRIPEETAHIGPDKRNACDREREEHRRRCRQVRPRGLVVARPNRCVSLRAGEECACENKRPTLGVRLPLPLEGCHVHQHAVEVVQLSMLVQGPVRVAVDQRRRHSNLGAVEDRWLVHVVPRVQVLGRAVVLPRQEARRPECPRLGHQVVDPRRAARPAVALKVRVVLVEHEQVARLGLGKRRIVVVRLEVRVDDGDHLSTGASELRLHRLRRRELERVPREVLLAVGVLNVEP